MGLDMHQAFLNILLVENIIAVIHDVSLVARDLFGYLTENTPSIHIARRCAPIVVHQLPRRSSLLACHTPRPVVVLNPIALSVEHIGALFYTLDLPSGNNIRDLAHHNIMTRPSLFLAISGRKRITSP